MGFCCRKDRSRVVDARSEVDIGRLVDIQPRRADQRGFGFGSCQNGAASCATEMFPLDDVLEVLVGCKFANVNLQRDLVKIFVEQITDPRTAFPKKFAGIFVCFDSSSCTRPRKLTGIKMCGLFW
jgi:hypothetical protein